VVRDFLIEAHRRGLTTGDYVFFCFEPYRLEEMFGNFDWERGRACPNWHPTIQCNTIWGLLGMLLGLYNLRTNQ
jgi:hypothetical protein